MIKDIREINFPEYATLDQATATINDMGDRSISAQVKIDGSVVPDFSFDWEVEFKGERYIHPVREPQGLKDNTSRKSKIDMTFYHWAIYEMKREFFMEMASTTAGTAVADKYIASLGLNLGDFVAAFNLVLNHYFGGKIVMKLNPEWQYDAESKFMNISYSYIWDVLQQMHEIYGVRWVLKTNSEGVCEILMGYPAEEVSHIFEYGFDGGLLSVQRQVQSTDIRNRILGRGGETNLPLRYFKDKDPNNPLFEADPDWIPELANIAFTELRGKTFRDYVKGWKAKHYDGIAMEEPTEAYLAGYAAEKFDPIEYVEDKDSVAKYGVLIGALENNEDIYPSIQGAPGDVDRIVDAEQVTDDNVDDAVEEDSVESNIEGNHYTKSNVTPKEEVSIEISARSGLVYFTVPEGKKGTIATPSFTVKGGYRKTGQSGSGNVSVDDGLITVYHDKCTFSIYDKATKQQVSRLNIPPGEYYYEATVVASHVHTGNINLTASVSNIHLIVSTDNSSKWSQTFNVWVRNIWGSERNAGETDQQYADRVWAPILGDREGNEARVVFASGWLSFSSDWEFPIVGYAYDDSKEGSHWRLTLAKSEAELEASGKYIPYEGYNASAGDRFFFIGIDMPHQYVLWAEERLDNFKRDSLLQTAQINPTWVIKTDKVRLNEDRNGVKLINQLNIGAQIRLANKQFIAGAYETLYVQSLTYNWIADTILYPDVEVVVSDKAVVVKNPVAQMQSSIDAIQRQVGSMSNIQQIIRQVCDKIYLRKDGVSDISKSPTKFLGKVTGEKFRQGQIGGRDWGIYRDENGNAIFEADKFIARQGILVSDLVVNEATYVGGLQINSAASLNVKTVNEAADGYVCFFDQKQGSVTNKFKIDDIVLCQKYDADQSVVKFYKARVIALGDASVTLSKTDINGTGIPAENDVIIQYGNYSDKTRQFVIIRDVIGGGYERMLMGLDSVTSDGVEYYFAGKSADSNARWFVGGTEQFAEYKDGQLTIKGNIFVTGSDKNINEQLAQIDFIREAFGENAQGLILGTAIIVGYTDENETFVPMAGLSGVYDKDVENGGPAAWYGGTPDDAKSVIFMDGTGYFADGLFRWDKDKGVNLGNGAIKINYDGSVEFGGDIKIGGTGEETLDSLLTAVATLFDYWSLDENGNLVTDKQVLIKNNLIVDEDTSSGGEGQDTPGGSGGVSEEDVLDILEKNNYITSSALSSYYTKAESDNRYLASSLLGSNTLIHSGNIGSYAFVPKSDSLASNVNADNYWSNGVYLNQTGNGSGNSNFPQSYSIFATFAQSVNYLAQLSIGYNSFYFRRKIDTWDEWREVIHSGNIGSYKAGDSALFDGRTSGEYYLSQKNGIPNGDLANLAAGSYYAASVKGDINPLPIDYCSLSVLGQSYYSQQLCMYHNATRAWLRGIYNTSSGASATEWHELAFLDSNVASATKLATARTIWGQSFDGTWDIGGSVGYALSLEFNGVPSTAGHGGFIDFHFNGASDDYSSRIIEDELGRLNLNYALYVKMGCNVGIGTASPLSKLQVGGQINVSHNSNKNYAFISQDDYTSNTSWMKLGTCYGYQTEVVAMTIYNGMVKIGNAIPTCELDVNGGIKATKPIFGYMYGTNNNAAAFIFDKPGLNYTGIGSDGVSDTIRFGACDINGTWVSYNQKWKFYGDIIVTGDVASA